MIITDSMTTILLADVKELPAEFVLTNYADGVSREEPVVYVRDTNQNISGSTYYISQKTGKDVFYFESSPFGVTLNSEVVDWPNLDQKSDLDLVASSIAKAYTHLTNRVFRGRR